MSTRHPLPQDERPRQRDRRRRPARQQPRASTPARRARSRRGRSSHFDQMMVLHDPKTAGTEAYMRIYNTDGSEAEACGNGMRCVGWVVAQQTGRKALKFETKAGVLDVSGRRHRRASPSTWASRRFGWKEIPLAEPFHDTRTHRAADRADRQADPAFAVGRQHRQSARGVLGRRCRRLRSRPLRAACSRTIRSSPSAPTSRSPTSPRPTPSRCAPGSAAPA